MRVKTQIGEFPFYRDVQKAMIPLVEARRVALALGIDPPLPAYLNEEGYQSVVQLSELIKGGEFRIPGLGYQLAAEFPAKSVSQILCTPEVGDVCLRANPHVISFLGENVLVRDFSITLTHAQLGSNRQDLDSLLKSESSGQVQLQLIGTSNSEVIIRGTPVTALSRASHKPIWKITAELSNSVPAEEWAKVPTDLSINLDHYLYGLPKDSE
jgi:hypothetical protein